MCFSVHVLTCVVCLLVHVICHVDVFCAFINVFSLIQYSRVVLYMGSHFVSCSRMHVGCPVYGFRYFVMSKDSRVSSCLWVQIFCSIQGFTRLSCQWIPMFCAIYVFTCCVLFKDTLALLCKWVPMFRHVLGFTCFSCYSCALSCMWVPILCSLHEFT